MTVFCIFKCFKEPLPIVYNRLLELEWCYCFGRLDARSSKSLGLENVLVFCALGGFFEM